MRFILLILFIYVINVNLAAQDKTKTHLQLLVGLSGGISESDFFGKEVRRRSEGGSYFIKRKGITAALQAKLNFGDYFFLRQYISYVEKGAQEKNSQSTDPLRGELNYISFPLLLGFQPLNFGNVDGVNLYIEGGISPNVLASTKNEQLLKGFAVTPKIHEFNWSFQIGAGVEVKLSERLSAFVNYSYIKDFTPFFEVFKVDTHYMFNKVSTLHAGLMFKVTEGMVRFNFD
jgi:opacity protein-like surface antigen